MFSLMRALALGVCACALVLPALPTRAAPDLPPVKIDAILSLTGAGAFFGNATAHMLSVVENATNKAGGLDGHPLKFVVLDDGSNPQTTVQLASQLAAEKAAAVIGPGLTSTCLAIEPIVAKAGPVSYCTSPSIEPAPGGYMFSAGPPADDTVISSVRYFRERGLRRIAMLTATDASGQAIDRAFDATLKLPENKSVVPVARQHFNPGDLSVSAQIANIKAANPQALLVWTAGTPFGTALRGIQEAGLDVPVCTGAGNMTYEQMQQYSQIMPKNLYFSALLGMAPGAQVPAPIRTAQEAYYRVYKDAGLRPDGVIAVPWDIALIYIDAFKHLGYNATADQVRDYIEHLHGFAGIDGIYDFRDGSQRGVGLNTDIIERWDPVQSAFVPASKPGGFP